MFSLIELPYQSLAPVISDQTLGLHHGKLLQSYVNNVNKLLSGSGLENKSLDEIVVISSGARMAKPGNLSSPSSLSTFGSTPTISSTKTAALLTSVPCGRS